MTKPLIRALSDTHRARENCTHSGNTEWEAKHTAHLAKLIQLLPSGSGIDNGTTLVSISPTKAVMTLGYHHMNDNGYYTHWTHHKVLVIATFDGISLAISGKNDNGIKEYLYDTYYECLTQLVED